MKKLSLFVSLVATQSIMSLCCGGEIYFRGGGSKAPGSSGILQILFNTAPDNFDFRVGGIALELNSSTPGVIEFTGGNVINGGRWDGAVARNLSDNQVGLLLGASVSSPGLPSGPTVVFAEIAYDVIGAPGASTEFSLRVLEDGLYDGGNPPGYDGTDVSGTFTFTNGIVTVVPEPGALALMAIAVLMARRTTRRY